MLQHSVQNVAPETVENFKNYETVEENRFFSSCKKKIAYISLLWPPIFLDLQNTKLSLILIPRYTTDMRCLSTFITLIKAETKFWSDNSWTKIILGM